MSLSGYISKRLSLRDGNRRKWPPAIVVAVAGIAVSFTVMMLSIAVVKGFKSEIKRKIMGFDAQVTVMPLAGYYGDGSATLKFDGVMETAVEESVREVAGNDQRFSVSLSASQPGILKTEDDFSGVVFCGYGEGHNREFERSVLTEGELPDSTDSKGIAISEAMASKLGLAVGDRIDAYFITDGNIRPRRFDVRGIYCSNFGEYDNAVVFAPYGVLSRLGRFAPGEGSRLEINGLDENEITAVAERLQSRLSAAYASGKIEESMAVSTVFSAGAIYFNWLDLLDTNVVVILILMGLVSGFTLISCVIILILQRVRMVGILKALGAGNSLIRGVFVRLGIRVTFAGLAIGNFVSLLLIWIQKSTHIVPLDPASYYLSYVPVETSPADWLLLNAGVVAVAFLIMLVPTGIAGRVSPVKTLRFE